jgi:DNA sulfur modification protein DndC
MSIQNRINTVANAEGKPLVVLIDDEEHADILRLIEANTWPNKWSGEEARADDVFEEIRRDGSVQESFLKTLVEGGAR